MGDKRRPDVELTKK